LDIDKGQGRNQAFRGSLFNGVSMPSKKRTLVKSIRKSSKPTSKARKKTTTSRGISAGRTGSRDADKKSIIKVGSVNGAQKFPKFKVSRSEAKLSKAELDHFRSLLLDKRREILGDVGSMENEAFKNQDNHSNSPMHMADVGTDNFEQEFTLGLIESERQLLREIQEALVRIEEGTYGVCVATSKPIGKARLEAKPWAKHCIEYTRMLEQGIIGREGQNGGDEEESTATDDDDE
jgi:DnaK suppressor protein